MSRELTLLGMNEITLSKIELPAAPHRETDAHRPSADRRRASLVPAARGR
jgi:hypothetical protein